MALQDMLILGGVIGAFTLFGGVLGFASWEETRDRRRRERQNS
jgi:hypothetical protein